MKKLAVILILWLPFSIGCIVAIIASLIGVLTDRYDYAKNLLRAMDKVLAACLGFTGYYTLSAECGIATRQPWTGLRWLLDKIQSDHCKGAAIREGLKITPT